MASPAAARARTLLRELVLRPPLLAARWQAVQLTPRRWLNLQEYQSKKLMSDNGVKVQRFFVADTANEALEAAKKLTTSVGGRPRQQRSCLLLREDAKEFVLKAQILAGGRGKGVFSSGLKGGVHLTKDPQVVGQLAKQMIGYNLATKQTPKEGVKVNKVMVAEALDISRETYLAILMDQSCNGPVLVGSPQGGVDIEEVAASNPELIFKEQIDIMEGIKDSQAQRMAENLGFLGPLKNQAADQIKKLYNLFLKIDATQVEVNPFGETPEGQVVCFDAKINFDDNAEFRQKDIFAMDDKSENEPIENEAAKYDLKYIGLDGNIACFVNGAGLAMATCDIILLKGGKPANFLDLGGGVKEAQVYQAFKLLTADPKVEAILVNIFAGIVNCAIIANGITKACQELELKVPLVVRLEGTNVHEARNILSNSRLPITSAVDLEDAAKKSVASVAKK
ncbi:succinate--CoA ligase [GDP-forming] subunit beta, mitochondrial isoform X1 [Canis lupus familiaris]|uniref:Succinate--CoA ligase [GDP-forming] subunit beta, mitochondrial n=2 Tax=Canis lupus familiaris TaxID=9615 RepID=A0A8C0S9C6_CANLF|nr:succinate--CoA ligase [GDP-forming] subunit beta, mitochondrial isoform X1 [Canis lupus familiaris]XP_038283112.1 succinate--CoA ligase [GDP-forming] subunit beta, mitochondrial isoform X1 [Canis lupus familiaris]XP_038421814.1 succinate--CoA ligase [GDP-forming] subunit beta, mitochondrial isoform X1 [Canis lupus familiaris]|eukprot:XP_013977083.1 succinate--CoA ligase [GDP-forming] subunit beta, mitochondrial isoform X1 [Canis lupus familiaris]